MVSDAVFDELPALTTILAEVTAVTVVVLTINVAEVFPARIVTELGTVAADFVLAMDTTKPPVGAGPLSVTVPVEVLPPFSVVGFRLKLKIDGALITKTALAVFPFRLPEIVAGV